jgi:hypothetical protein
MLHLVASHGPDMRALHLLNLANYLPKWLVGAPPNAAAQAAAQTESR